MRLLLLEDDSTTGRALARRLMRERFVVDVTSDREEAEELAEVVEHDAILLGRLGPRGAAVDACRRLRVRRISTPILVLATETVPGERVAALDAGADDCLSRPFAFEELVARIHALLRRGARPRPPILRCGDLTLDPASHAAHRGERRLELTAKQEAILEILLRNAGTVVTRTMLVEHVWASECDNVTNLVDVHMSRLRRKLHAAGPPVIHTVRGRGFRLGPEAGAAPAPARRDRPGRGPVTTESGGSS